MYLRFYSILSMIAAVVAFFSPAAKNSVSAVSSRNMATAAGSGSSFYDIVEKTGTGEEFSFSQFKGKVVYGVNVASKCGYTASGYNLIAKLAALKEKGVEVALFPCNQFGGQEPGTDAEVAQFCSLKGVKGATLFSKGDVNGPKTRPTYKYLKEKGVLGDVAWNFAGKFIVDKEGNVLPVKSEKNIEQDILALASK